jgi:choline dehydrogenase
LDSSTRTVDTSFRSAMSTHTEAYEYVIVGAGSAGCVLAARLTEDRSTRVLLLEAGGAASAREVRIPAAFSKLYKTAVDWDYATEPERCLHHRKLYWPRGKMIGGSGSMNAMIYIRGNATDYDHWASLGNEGWRFRDVLAYFKKSERQGRGASEFHGASGPLYVADLRCVNPLTRSFLSAANELGIPANSDFNGGSQDGAGLYQVTQKRGQRHSTADGYLKPALARENLTVLTHAHAARIVIENHRAVGIAYIRAGATETVRAERAVVLAGGAVNSPQLLLLSGVGPADEIRRAGVGAVHDVPGVGKNLQDHLMVSVGYLCTRPVSMANAESLTNVLRYLVFKRGPLVSNVAEAGIFWRTRDGLHEPDLQLLFGPGYYVNHGLVPRKEHCFGFGPTLLTPESRGSIALKSADPLEPPAIRANYLSSPDDMRVIIEGVKLSRQLAQTKAFEAYRGGELHPGSSVQSDEEIANFIRAEAETLYHPVGTCKMGNDSMAVVDDRLCVHGVDGLRVVDASVMPRIPAGNTNAPTIMIAEKAADMIRADAK